MTAVVEPTFLSYSAFSWIRFAFIGNIFHATVFMEDTQRVYKLAILCFSQSVTKELVDL